MYYCTNCGNQVDDNEQFCTKCGTKVDENSNNSTAINNQVYNSVSVKKTKKVVGIVAAVLIIIAIIGTVISFRGSNSFIGKWEDPDGFVVEFYESGRVNIDGINYEYTINDDTLHISNSNTFEDYFCKYRFSQGDLIIDIDGEAIILKKFN